MEIQNDNNVMNLAFLKSRILTLEDVVDFCQREGNNFNK